MIPDGVPAGKVDYKAVGLLPLSEMLTRGMNTVCYSFVKFYIHQLN
jgi:hypothetical protein